MTQFTASHDTRALIPQEWTPLASLIKWRQVFIRLGLVGGGVPDRYQGLGFGNLSGRISDQSFLITGSQTGRLTSVTHEHFAVITQCCPQENHVVSHGLSAPSSESLTHGVLYALNPDLRWVFHVHSPEIWSNRDLLMLPCTTPVVGYGTPEMALEVEAIVCAAESPSGGVIAMGGHEDGLLSFDREADRCGQALLDLYHRARAE